MNVWSLENFIVKVPIDVLNVTRQNETVKSGPIDIRISVKTLTNSLVIHDKLFE